jgi:hypothetical protein
VRFGDPLHLGRRRAPTRGERVDITGRVMTEIAGLLAQDPA